MMPSQTVKSIQDHHRSTNEKPEVFKAVSRTYEKLNANQAFKKTSGPSRERTRDEKMLLERLKQETLIICQSTKNDIDKTKVILANFLKSKLNEVNSPFKQLEIQDLSLTENCKGHLSLKMNNRNEIVNFGNL